MARVAVISLSDDLFRVDDVAGERARIGGADLVVEASKWHRRRRGLAVCTTNPAPDRLGDDAIAEGLENAGDRRSSRWRASGHRPRPFKWRSPLCGGGLDGLFVRRTPHPGAVFGASNRAMTPSRKRSRAGRSCRRAPGRGGLRRHDSRAFASMDRGQSFPATAPSDHSSHLVGPSACSRIARRPSSCRAIPSSWRRSATSSVCIWRALAGGSSHPPGSLCRRKEPDPGPDRQAIPSVPLATMRPGQADHPRRSHDYKRQTLRHDLSAR